MKAFVAMVVLFGPFLGGSSMNAEPGEMVSEPAGTRDNRMGWWRDAKFGLFIHWGPASVAGTEISWSRIGHPFDHPGHESVPPETYDKLYERFNPVQFDADEWMKLAQEAGMKYVVFVAKHHDGFSLWPTKLRDYSIMNSPFRRDICGEIAEAAHRRGLRLGWYYSTRDWTHPDYLKGDNRAYNAFYQGQVKELLTHYGRIDVLWFDHTAGNWKDYTFEDLFRMMNDLQPGILVNDRAARFIRPTQDEPGPGVAELVAGDFDTPEQRIGTFQDQRAWESCVTMTKCADGGGWSYRPDGQTRSYEECIRMLVSTVTGDGNLLLNVGPMPTGEILPDQVEVLRRMGRWLGRHGESIYETRGGPVRNGQWGGTCSKGNAIYVHVLRWDKDLILLPGLRGKVLDHKVLTGGKAKVESSEEGVILRVAPADQDPLDTIVKLEMDAPVK